MKKITLCIITTCLLLTFQPMLSNAASNTAPAALVASKSTESAEANALLQRLNQINAMDKSSLKSSDKKQLRNEVLSIRHRYDDIGGGVYISLGSVLLILILLIILL